MSLIERIKEIMGKDFDKEEAIKMLQQEVDDAKATDEAERKKDLAEEDKEWQEKITKGRAPQLKKLEAQKYNSKLGRLNPYRQRYLNKPK